MRRIHVTLHLRLRPEQRDAAERAHRVYADRCPVYRTIRNCVDVTSSLDLEQITP